MRLAVTASAGLVLALWLPWYRFRIPAAMLDQIDRLSGQFGGFAPYVRAGEAVLRNAGTLKVDAWTALHGIDAVLAVAGTVAFALVALELAGRADGVGGLVAGCGVVALTLCLYRTLSPPGNIGLLHPTTGAYLATLAAAGVVAGGLLMRCEPAVESWQAQAVPYAVPAEPVALSASVPPPS